MTKETFDNQYTTVINGLVDLTGSEKQIAWAKKIRNHLVYENIELVEDKCKKYSNGLCDLNATREKINAVLNEDAIKTIISIFNRAQDSKFWIDNRDLMWFEINRKLMAIS